MALAPVQCGMTAEPETMAELLAQHEQDERALRPPRRGETVEGIVASVSGDDLLIDLSGRMAGVLSRRELAGEEVAPGDVLAVTVVHPEGPDGHAILAYRQRPDGRWREAAERQRQGEIVEAEVIEANRGGVVVDVGLRGFVPLSQIASLGPLPREAGGSVPEAVQALRGRRLSLKVIEVDPVRQRLILSEKAAVQDLRRRRKAQAAEELSVGQVLTGRVSHITGFGLFVDVGVAEGLVHRSEVTWDKSANPLALHRVGDEVQVIVTAIDPERDRISLSIRRLLPDPWDAVTADLDVGTDHDAEITRLMPFGAFARLGQGIEGLIHVSELTDRRVTEPSEVVAVGDPVRVRVVAVEPERRRLSLSMRQVGPTS